MEELTWLRMDVVIVATQYLSGIAKLWFTSWTCALSNEDKVEIPFIFNTFKNSLPTTAPITHTSTAEVTLKYPVAPLRHPVFKIITKTYYWLQLWMCGLSCLPHKEGAARWPSCTCATSGAWPPKKEPHWEKEGEKNKSVRGDRLFFFESSSVVTMEMLLCWCLGSKWCPYIMFFLSDRTRICSKQ